MSDINIKINLITKQAEAQLTKLNKALGNVGDKANKAEKGTKKLNAGFGRMSDIVKGIVSANLFFAIGRQITNFVTGAVKEFAEFETALVGVAKTTNLSAEEFEKFSEEIKTLSKQLPNTRSELANIAKLGGQLGVTGVKNLTKFTKTIAQLTLATDLTADAAALALTRLLNITDEPIDGIDSLASSIVDVGNKFAATETEIVNISSELARATAGFNVSSESIVGIAGALKSLGVRAEGGGTAIGKVFRKIEEGVTSNTPLLREFAKVAGVSAEEFEKKFRENALGAFTEFIEGAKRLDDAGVSIGTTLNNVGLNTDRVSKVLRPLITRSDELARGITTATDAMIDNTAASKEAARGLDTLNSQYDIFKNNLIDSVDDVAAPFGKILKSIFTVKNEITQVEDAFEKALEIDPATVESAISAVTIIEKTILDAQGKLLSAEAASNLIRLNENLKTLKSRASLEHEYNQRSFQRTVLNEKGKLEAEREAKRASAAATAESNRVRFENELATNESILAAHNEKAIAEEQLRLSQTQLSEQHQALALLSFKDYKARELEDLKLSNIDKEKEQIKYAKEAAKIEAARTKRSVEISLKANENSKKLTKEQLDGKRTTSRAFASLAQAENKTLAAIGKAGAVAEIAINTPKSISSAFAFGTKVGGPPLGFVFGAVAAAFQAQQAASVAGLKFQDGGIVPGESISGDKVTARVNSGEMILNKQQQTSLFNQINSGNGQSAGSDVPLQNNIIVEIDGETITKVVSRSVANGAVLGEVGV